MKEIQIEEVLGILQSKALALSNELRINKDDTKRAEHSDALTALAYLYSKGGKIPIRLPDSCPEGFRDCIVQCKRMDELSAFYMFVANFDNPEAKTDPRAALEMPLVYRVPEVNYSLLSALKRSSKWSFSISKYMQKMPKNID